MKNNNVKEMIRQQKMMAEERKDMVSANTFELIKLNRNSKRRNFNSEIDLLIAYLRRTIFEWRLNLRSLNSKKKSMI